MAVVVRTAAVAATDLTVGGDIYLRCKAASLHTAACYGDYNNIYSIF